MALRAGSHGRIAIRPSHSRCGDTLRGFTIGVLTEEDIEILSLAIEQHAEVADPAHEIIVRARTVV
jgi:hypothetical protein